MTDVHDPDRREALRQSIDRWLEEFARTNDLVAAVDRGTSDDTSHGDPRWYVRMIGEEKDFTTVWLTLGQRTLRYETYVMPAPEENQQMVFHQLLERNHQLVGASFSIGGEQAVFLGGQLVNQAIDEAEIDRVLGTVYTAVEAAFRPLLRLAFASRFRG